MSDTETSRVGLLIARLEAGEVTTLAEQREVAKYLATLPYLGLCMAKLHHFETETRSLSDWRWKLEQINGESASAYDTVRAGTADVFKFEPLRKRPR